MDEARITAELNACPLRDEELSTRRWENGYDDEWSVQRAYALE